MISVERWRDLRASRRALGRCYKCGARTGVFKACDECRCALRDKRAAYMRAYRLRQKGADRGQQ